MMEDVLLLTIEAVAERCCAAVVDGNEQGPKSKQGKTEVVKALQLQWVV
jgi:hypothetical protein